MKPIIIALAGFPNCGKTTLFNALTGSHHPVGNWSGVTVALKRAEAIIGQFNFQFVDLPGCHFVQSSEQGQSLKHGQSSEQDKSLEHSTPIDQRITQQYLNSGEATCLLNVINATELEQQLPFTLELLELNKLKDPKEIKELTEPREPTELKDPKELKEHGLPIHGFSFQGLPIIVVLNMMDAAAKKGITIDIEALSSALGCVVVPMTALEKQGLPTLKNRLLEALCPVPSSQNHLQQIHCITSMDASPTSKASLISNAAPISNAVPISNAAPISNFSPTATDSVSESTSVLPFLRCTQQNQSFSLPLALEKRVQRIQQAKALANKVCRVCQKAATTQRDWSALLDKFFLHKALGLPLLLGLMYIAFGLTTQIGGGIQSFFAAGLQKVLIEIPEAFLLSIAAPAWLIRLITQGLGQGIHTTLSFMPVIAVMFLCLSFLEASGYMTRAAMVVDKIMRLIGLSGKSFIPMILGFGCNVPAVLATRTLECRRERILTILMSPFMSCGARLAIYALFVTAFFKEGGHNVIFALYCIGIAMALLTGWVLRNTLLIGNKSSLKMELPPYRLPRLKMMLRTTFHRTLSFVTKAGLIIVPLCILFGLLGAFKVGEESWLAFIGQYITPLLAPMGIQPDNWPATVGLLTGVVAKEVVVGTLNTLYAASSGGVGTLVDHFISTQAAFAYLLFVLLYFPCVSVLATISRELNFGWATFTAAWTTGIAYGAAVLFYQLSTFSEHPESSLLWTITILGISMLVWMGLRVVGRYTVGKKPQKPLPTQILILNS